MGEEGFKLHAGILELIAGMALLKLEGGTSASLRPEQSDDRLKKNLIKGVKVTSEGEKVSLVLELNVDYGQDILKVAAQAQELAAEAVETMTGYTVTEADVNIVGVNAP